MSYAYYIKTETHTTGTHHDGHCSDAYDICDIDSHTTEIIDVPNKQFIKKYCDSDGEINWDGLSILSKKDRLCNGSGYCGCEVTKTVTKAKLYSKQKNIKKQFMAEESSDDEDEYTATSSIKNKSSTKKKTGITKKKKTGTASTKNTASSKQNKNKTNSCENIITTPVNAFRGRFNSTYTANPGWYNNF